MKNFSEKKKLVGLSLLQVDTWSNVLADFDIVTFDEVPSFSLFFHKKDNSKVDKEGEGSRRFSEGRKYSTHKVMIHQRGLSLFEFTSFFL